MKTTKLYVSLHTGNPGRGGDQTHLEAIYEGYTRVAVECTEQKWNIIIDHRIGEPSRIENAGNIDFAECVANKQVARYFAVGTNETGPGNILISGKLSAPLQIFQGLTPRFLPGAVSLEL